MRRCPSLTLLTSAALLLAACPANAAWPTSPYVNLPVCTAAANQLLPSVIADGAGGCYVSWDDLRSGELRPYLQHLTATGAISPGWPVDGLRVADAGTSRMAHMVPGPSGSVILAWQDFRMDGVNSDIYATRVEANGTFGVGWPANGRQLSSSVGRSDHNIAVCTDGAGGVFVTWELDFGTLDHDIYASRVLANGTYGPGVTSSGLIVAGSSIDQNSPDIVADGSGNAIIAWVDKQASGNSHYDVYARKLLASGALGWSSAVQLTDVGSASDAHDPRLATDGSGGAAMVCQLQPVSGDHTIAFNRVSASGALPWGTFGLPVASSPIAAMRPVLAGDGAGGWILAWEDYRAGAGSPAIYAARVLPTGSVVWTPGGVVATSSTGYLTAAQILPDGAGGAILTWEGTLGNSGAYVRAQRLGPGGQRVWGADGSLISAASGSQSRPVLCTDGTGGAIFAWMDGRSLVSTPDIYAQRVDAFGALGDATPRITRIADVPNDQGGQVSLQWTASALDAEPDRVVANYSLWRRVPGGTVPGDLHPLAPEVRSPLRGPAYRTSLEGGQVIYWEFVTTKPAAALTGYSAVIVTTSDSSAAGNPLTSLRVRAETADGSHYWDSLPDSGYSVDNLPPITPAPFTGSYANGDAVLQWGANLEPDFAAFRLHRGLGPSFIPTAANLVIESAATTFVDHAGGPFWYMLAARDVHGNLSAYARLLPGGTVGTPHGLPARFALALVSPQPVRGAAAIRYTLPEAASVDITIFDAAGRRVRGMVSERRDAGEYLARWDGLATSGADAGPGLYFVRMRAGVFTGRARLVRLR